MRADFKGVDWTVIEGAQVGGSIRFFCVSFRVFCFEQLSVSALWVNAEILFRKISIIFVLQSCLQTSLKQHPQEKKSKAYMIVQGSDGDGIGFRGKASVFCQTGGGLPRFLHLL